MTTMTWLASQPMICVKYLLESYSDGHTPLHTAVRKNTLDVDKGTICQIIIIESRILDSIEGWYLYSYSSFWSEGSKDLEARRRRTSKGGAVDEALQCTGVNMHFLELKNTVHPQIYRGIVPQHQLYLRQSNRTAKKFTLHICQQHVS